MIVYIFTSGVFWCSFCWWASTSTGLAFHPPFLDFFVKFGIILMDCQKNVLHTRYFQPFLGRICGVRERSYNLPKNKVMRWKGMKQQKLKNEFFWNQEGHKGGIWWIQYILMQLQTILFSDVWWNFYSTLEFLGVWWCFRSFLLKNIFFQSWFVETSWHCHMTQTKNSYSVSQTTILDFNFCNIWPTLWHVWDMSTTFPTKGANMELKFLHFGFWYVKHAAWLHDFITDQLSGLTPIV